MAIEHEVVIEFTKMLTDHIETLWKTAGGLLLVEVLIVSHVLASERVSFHRSKICIMLFCSAIFCAVSIISGYFANGATLSNFQAYAAGHEWVPSSVAEILNLIQMVTLALGFLIFLLAFFFYSTTFAKNLIEANAIPKLGKGNE